MSDTTPKDELAGTEQPFVQHLIELRDRLVKATIAVMVAGAALAIYPGPAELYDMLAAPLVAHLGRQLGDWLERRTAVQNVTVEPEFGDLRGHVIIAGYGRVGQMVGQLLAAQGVRFVAIEHDATLLAHHRRQGVSIVFGDASRPELLGKLKLEQARAVVLTMDDMAAALHAVHGVRRMMSTVQIIARARDEPHALILLEAGASLVVPETLESSLKLAGLVLHALDVPTDVSDQVLTQERERCMAALREAALQQQRILLAPDFQRRAAALAVRIGRHPNTLVFFSRFGWAKAQDDAVQDQPPNGLGNFYDAVIT